MRTDQGVKFPVLIKERTYITPCTVQVVSGKFYIVEPETSWIANTSGASPDTLVKFAGWISDSQTIGNRQIYALHDTAIAFNTVSRYKTTITYSLNDLPGFSSSQQAWYLQDTIITVKAPNIPGYTFVNWIINNSERDTDTVLTIKVNGSLVITGKYTRLFHVSISTSADSSIEMIINGTKKSAPIQIDVADSTSLTLLPKTPEFFETSSFVAGNDTRYDFAYWENDGQLSPERSDIITSDSAFKAIYKKSFFVEIHGYSTDSTISDIKKWLPKDTIIQVSPLILNNMAFSNWVINGNTVENNPLLVLKINEPKSITALYGQLVQLTVLTEPAVSQIIITIGDSSCTSIGSKVLTKGTKAKFGVAPIQEFKTSDIVDGTDIRYEFVNWYNESETTNPLTRQIDSSVVYKAAIRTKYKIEVNSKSEQNKLSSISYFCPKDTTIVLTPNTFSGYKFSHWNINKDSVWTGARLAIKMNEPKYIEGVYLKTNSISITSLPDDSMIISVQGVLHFTPYSFQLQTGDSVAVSVNSPIFISTDSSFSGPSIQYTFKNWFNSTSTNNTTTIYSANNTITQFLMQKSFMVQIATMPQKMGISQQNQWFNADTAILLSAPSYPGYFFDHWEIDNTDTVFSSQVSVSITKPLHVKAVYDPFFTVRDMDSLFVGWQPILGSDGPKTLDGLVAYYTPDCKQFSGGGDIQSFADKFRESMISSMKLDLNKLVLSDQLQRTFTDSSYTIEVHRLEVFNGLYLSENVYLPSGRNYQECPLIIMAPGCGSDLSSEYMQDLAGNLATFGMVVVSADGFCSNGNRGNIDISSMSPAAYGRELIGLPCPVSVFTQELISTVSWAISKYPIINPQKIGCTGYSHGGQMCIALSQIDKRISCVSIPATLIGSTCGNISINTDIYVLPEYGPDFTWSAPVEVPLRPLNSEFALIFPDYVHSTFGTLDSGANSAYEKPVYDYATQMYSTAGLQDRISFNTDADSHNYNIGRREDTYEWFSYVFNGTPIQHFNEIPIQMHSYDELEPNISGTTTLSNEFQNVIQSIKSARFNGTTPTSDVSSRTSVAMDQLFGDFKQDNFSVTMKISKTWNDLKISGYRFDGLYYSLPIVIFQNLKLKNGSQALYLPKAGTSFETDTIISLLNRYGTVISIDYFGIGELTSDRVMLITYADDFMNNNPCLPKMIVNSLRSYLKTTNGAFDVLGNGWASSFFASCLQYLEPRKISKSILYGVPSDELGILASGSTNTPHLLLWNGLFSKITVAEIDAVNKMLNP